MTQVATARAGKPVAPAPPLRQPRRGRRVSAGPWVAAAVLLTWCAVHLVTGTPWTDLLGWLGAVGLGMLGPGTALVRAVRPGRAPLVEDLAWGSAAGCLVALTGWLVDRLLPWSPGPLVWGPLVVSLLLAVPATRRRVLARPEPGWGTGPSVAMGLLMIVAITWMSTTSLAWLPVNPGRAGVLYSQDTMFQAGMVGELRHHLVPQYPFVAGTSLHYHWFLYAILAHLTTGTGIDPFDASLRLGPSTVLPAVLLLAAVVARRMSGRIGAGPIAMALLAAVDLTLANRWGWQGSSALGGAYSPVIGFWRGSPPQELGWLAGIAALGSAVAWVRRGRPDRAIPTALLLPFLVLCAGAKSSELPVLAAGVGAALLAALVGRRWAQAGRAAALLAACAAVFGLATVVIYRGGSYGMIIEPGDRFLLQSAQLFPGLSPSAAASWVAVTTAFLVATLPLLPRLAGLVWLAGRRPEDPGTWVSIGVLVGGFTATYLLRHPAQSELYFLISAYPLAVVGSAGGLTAMCARFALGRGAAFRSALSALAGSVVAGALAAAALAWSRSPSWPLVGWAGRHPDDPTALGASPTTQAGWYLQPILELAGVLAAVILVIVLVIRLGPGLVTRGRARGVPIRVALAPVVVSVLIGTGVYGMSQSIAGTGNGTLAHRSAYFLSRSGTDGVLPTTQDLVDGGRWLQRHAGVDDVVAVNRYCVNTRAWSEHRSRCDAREFSPSALSQRRSYVGGWAYSDEILADAWSTPVPYRKIAFWDPVRLAAQDAAFQEPTGPGLEALYAQGVRWLWADLRDGPVATTSLDQLAGLRYAGPDLRIWQLRPPSR